MEKPVRVLARNVCLTSGCTAAPGRAHVFQAAAATAGGHRAAARWRGPAVRVFGAAGRSRGGFGGIGVASGRGARAGPPPDAQRTRDAAGRARRLGNQAAAGGRFDCTDCGLGGRAAGGRPWISGPTFRASLRGGLGWRPGAWLPAVRPVRTCLPRASSMCRLRHSGTRVARQARLAASFTVLLMGRWRQLCSERSTPGGQDRKAS